MKKGNNTIEHLMHILSDETLCTQLLTNDDSPFLDGTRSKKEYLDEFAHLLNSTVFIMKKTHNFHYLPLTISILNRFYLNKMKEDPFSFYENSACRGLLELLQKFPNELEPFQKFLADIHFENSKDEIGRFYHKQMEKNRILNDFELKDLLNYLMIYKNRFMPHHYFRYLFYVLFQKDHRLELSPSIHAELFRFLILDLLNQLNWKENVHVVSLGEEKPFIYQGPDIYINLDVMKTTLEENLEYLPYLFDLFEKRYKYKSFAHNKYEEIKSKKQSTIKEILGSSYFYENYSYLSIEQEIADRSLIARLRFLEDIAPTLYTKIIEDYEKQIIETVKNNVKKEEANHLVITLDELLNQTVLLAPEVIKNQNYLTMEYQEDGRKKRLVELLESYEQEISNPEEHHQALAHYYEEIILGMKIHISRLVDEFITLVEYPIKEPATDYLLEQIFCKSFVREINYNINNHILTHQELESILSKMNQYMEKFYEVEQKKISKYLIKEPEKWAFLNTHLSRLYHSVQYMSNAELYENSYLNLTQVLDFDEAKKVQKKIIQKKIMSQKVYMAVLIILILIFSISLFLLGRIIYQYWSANDSYEKIQNKVNQTKPIPILTPDKNRTEFPMNDSIPQVDFEPLKSENEQVIAWIRIDDTDVNYPVVQGEDNEYYLTHLYNKKYNISGSIFGDYRNNLDFSSNNMVLYGHNMKNGSMFGTLKKYKDKEYFDNHKYVWLITPKATYQYEIYAAYEFDAMHDQYEFNFDSETKFQEYLDNIKQKSIIESELEVTAKDHTLTMSTCIDGTSSSRLVLVAKRMVSYIAQNKET